MTIRSRLLVLVLSVLLPTVAAALWLIAHTYQSERHANERNLRDTTRALALVVGRELEQRAAVARVLALSRSLDGAPRLEPDELREFEGLARRAMVGLQGWVELGLPGQLLVSTAQSPQPGDSSLGDDLVPAPVVTPLRPAASGGALRAALVQPVQRGGVTRLNLTVTILPAELQQIIDQQGLPAEWTATVLDSRHSVVARYPGGTRYAGRAATPDLQRQLAAAAEGLFSSVTLDGGAVTGYFSHSPQGWTFITAMPREGFVAGLPPAVLRAGLVALLLLGVTIAAALWVGRRIAQPVQSLKQAAADLQAGRPVQPQRTGIAECDEVHAALAEAAQSLQGSRAELERQVADAVARTRAAEQRVSQRQRVEALGRLTAGVAHDFNNLLGVISNSAHLIDRQAGDRPELRMPVASTLRAVDAGTRLTQHLTRFSGRHTLRPRLLDLVRYLPEAQDLIQTVVGKRVRLQLDVAPDTPPVSVDAGELELALINLAFNARDALPEGGQVWLSAGPAPQADLAGLAPGAYARLTVSDDGAGMDEDVAQHVFEPFYTTKPLGHATGLGLSQVHGFCQQAGGAARIASTPGLGTAVTLLLPAASGQGAARDDTPPAAPASTSGLRVLLVDDNEALAEVTAALLETQGCSVLRASGSNAALQLLALQAAALDVVLSDVVMPDEAPGAMDGLALARTIRQRWPALPVVLISGYSESGADGSEFTLLRKPCPPQELLDALRAAVAASRLPAA